jgi:hypothetical protein
MRAPRNSKAALPDCCGRISKSIATLDYASNGRAGVRVRVSGSLDEAAHVGRRVSPLATAQLLDEAAGYEASTLRGLLGLSRPASRYATARSNSR